MAFADPLQWIVIGIVVIVIFLWGPQKIPELARGLGRVRREFEQASKEMTDSVSGVVPKLAPDMTGDQALIETARQLGISTEGKTREQISQEVVNKVNTR